VENDRTDNIKHDLHLDVENERFSHIKVNDHLTVDGESRQHVKGDQTLMIDGTLHLKQGKAILVDAGNEIHIKAGNKVVIEAGAEITLKAGGSFIKIDASGVSFVGAAVNLNSGGSAGSGSGYAGILPLLPGAVETAVALAAITLINWPQQLEAMKGKVPVCEVCMENAQ
ncbi:type VI secretion system tip protein VgrG, partial [Photobacterium phosphoreum]|uniref:bacteriophage T4 gp5 trimerisation domain-containing protein n=1 Tax=Photobacterium phosphoreum TaxID=659 RepID=UPI000D42258A